MVLNTTKETVCVNQIVGQKVETVTVEGDMIVPDIKPDILNTISNSGNVCIYKKEVLDGKIRIDGCINVYIAYIADNETGDMRSLNTSLDFTTIIDFDGCRVGMSLDENIVIKTIESKAINERKITIKVLLEANVKVYSNEEIEVVNEVLDMPNLQMLEDVLEINSLVGEGETRVYAKETIAIDPIDDLAEILKVEIRIINKDNKISYNKVLAKADAEVKIMYLTEDNRINSVVCKIPVMGFIDMENVSDTNICNTKYKLKNLIIKPNNVEEHSIYVEAEIEIICFVYENKNVRIIQDLYAPNRALNFTQKGIETRAYKESVNNSLQFKEKFMLEDPNDRIFDTETRINIVSTRVQNGAVIYELELELDYMYGNANFNQLQTRNIKFSLNHSVELDSDESTIVETNIEVQNVSVIVLPDMSAELNANIGFEVNTYKDEVLNIIDEINYEEGSKLNTYSLVIYYVKTGDSLWKIAKEFNSTVEEIASINNIENIDRIDIGRQLFIPRYIEIK